MKNEMIWNHPVKSRLNLRPVPAPEPLIRKLVSITMIGIELGDNLADCQAHDRCYYVIGKRLVEVMILVFMV